MYKTALICGFFIRKIQPLLDNVEIPKQKKGARVAGH